MDNKDFWKGRKVFITGHTGFKGSWLSLMLSFLGADVTGYALKPPTRPSLFELCNIGRTIDSNIGNILDIKRLKRMIKTAKPEIVIHMAAQAIVRQSYQDPLETYHTNMIGTANLFEAVRSCNSIKAVINVTTDKCYDNPGKRAPFKEDEKLGGYDPYSNSKACSELVTSSYRSSFFNPGSYKKHRVAIASARAGNVIGGGDWAKDRLIPDFVRSILAGKKIDIRNPKAIRPWQHVLDPLKGYLMLAEKLCQKGVLYGEAWNFGPDAKERRSVEWVVKKLCNMWGDGADYRVDKKIHPHEASYLQLDCSKAHKLLAWRPKWHIETALDKIVEWTKTYKDDRKNIKSVCLRQINEFMKEE